MAVPNWSAAHWFELLQSAGIVFGLLFTAFALRSDQRAKRVQTLLTVTEHHRNLWTQLYSRPELSRVATENPDLTKKPVVFEEELFVNLVILNLRRISVGASWNLRLSRKRWFRHWAIF